MLSRRRFLQTSSLVSLSPVLPRVLAHTAQAAAAGPDQKALVVIQLDGGNDGVNTVVPFDDGYGRARDKLRLDAAKLHKLDYHVGLHPNMAAAKELFDDGRLTIVQGVGYPNPDRSHFRSMKIWQTASLDDADHTGYGWLGRALDSRPARAAAGSPGAIYVGDDETPIALWGRRSEATSLSRAADLRLMLNPSSPTEQPLETDDSLASFVSKQVLSAYAAADEYAEQSRRQTHYAASYPDTALGARLQLVSQLLQSGGEARVYYTSQGGYDTHAAQLYTHGRLLREFSGALKAFLDDLKAARLDDRVVVLAFSEFGRRVKENESKGTDHGTAGPVFLAGAPVRGGLVNGAPSLTDLVDGDLKVQTDFREIYATLLGEWLNARPTLVLRGEYSKLPLLRQG